MRSVNNAALLLILGAAAACSDAPNQVDARDQQQNAPASAASAASPAAVGPTAAPSAKDWTTEVAATEGGFRMGNPDAPVQLIEFASFSCPHCGEFYRTGFQALKDEFIKPGLVSFEFRSFLLGAPDVPVTLLAYCQTPEAFFAVEHGLFTDQEKWMEKLRTTPDSEVQRLQSLPPDQAYLRLLGFSGLDEFFRVRGLPAARQAQCINDRAMIDRLSKVRNEAIERYKIQGTPSFVVDGKLLEGVATWQGLRANLREAVQ
jgi:protein-disulfide isomerase